MNFTQRLAYYLLGLLIGSFVVYYFWNAKDSEFCYLPNCRVLKDIRSKSFVIDDKAKNAQEFSKEELKTFLTNGDVDFDKSNVPEDGGKKYVIEAFDEQKQQKVEIIIINYSNKAVLKSISYKQN